MHIQLLECMGCCVVGIALSCGGRDSVERAIGLWVEITPISVSASLSTWDGFTWREAAVNH